MTEKRIKLSALIDLLLERHSAARSLTFDAGYEEGCRDMTIFWFAHERIKHLKDIQNIDKDSGNITATSIPYELLDYYVEVD